MDVITSSGPGTGYAASVEKARALRSGAGKHPLALARRRNTPASWCRSGQSYWPRESIAGIRTEPKRVVARDWTPAPRHRTCGARILWFGRIGPSRQRVSRGRAGLHLRPWPFRQRSLAVLVLRGSAFAFRRSGAATKKCVPTSSMVRSQI
jgi:hypothetical protein